jgi:chorismate mutase
LSPDLKRRVASDVAVGDIPYSDKLQVFVSAQPEQVRNELREALIATGLSPKEIEKRFRF